MEITLLLLIALPLFAAPLLAVLPRPLHGPALVGTVSLVMMAAVYGWAHYVAPVSLTLPHGLHPLLIGLDFAVMALFFYAGVKNRHPLVWAIALLQLALFSWLVFGFEAASLNDLRVDRLGLTLMLLVSVVGGLIAVYAVTYMRYEETSQLKRQSFAAILVAFLGVMNLLAVADSIELFFLLFELTTLASYLLIGWRGDEVARENSLRALWMNQIGGAALLIAMLVLAAQNLPLYFSPLIEAGSVAGGVLIAFAFLSVAALVKGAQMPFDRWLLGAMVAPTPVSAILHSSTMVKIAPFMILKFAPLIAGTALGVTLSFFGGFVFVAAAFLALGKRMFKEILAYSTISLLGLMILLAAIGTPLAMTAAVTLMLFHGVAKAMLFMEAGVLEKLHHLKSVEDMGGLLTKAPVSVFLILLGFASVTLPPFGALVGKWVALEASLSAAFVFAFIALGSVVITLLYFKVAGFMLGKSGQQSGLKIEFQPPGFGYINAALGALLALSALLIAPVLTLLISPVAAELSGQATGLALSGLGLVMPAGTLPFWQIAGSLVLMLLLPLAAFWHLRGVDRAREYSGGERIEMAPVTFYFTPSIRLTQVLTGGGIAFFAATLLAGVLA